MAPRVLLAAIVGAMVVMMLSSLARADETPASTVEASDAGKPTISKAELTFQLDQEKANFQKAAADIEALDREIQLARPYPDPPPSTALATAVQALRTKVAAAAGKPIQNSADCGVELSNVLNGLGLLSEARAYVPWRESDYAARSGASSSTPVIVLEARQAVQLPRYEMPYNTLRALATGRDFQLFFCGEIPLNTIPDAERVQNELATAVKEAQGRTSKYTGELVRKKEEASTRQQKAKKRVGELGTQLGAMELEEKSERKTANTVNLDIIKLALISMPVFVVALFAGSFLFGSPLQERIFANRTVVELVGLALLLMTIIILGTSERIERAALGALLGSIAGYVFSQQAQRMAMGQSRGAAPGGPPPPAPAPAPPANGGGGPPGRDPKLPPDQGSTETPPSDALRLPAAAAAAATPPVAQQEQEQAPPADTASNTAIGGWLTKDARIRFILIVLGALTLTASYVQFSDSGTDLPWRDLALVASAVSFGAAVRMAGHRPRRLNATVMLFLLAAGCVAVSYVIPDRRVAVARLLAYASAAAWGVALLELSIGFAPKRREGGSATTAQVTTRGVAAAVPGSSAPHVEVPAVNLAQEVAPPSSSGSRGDDVTDLTEDGPHSESPKRPPS